MAADASHLPSPWRRWLAVVAAVGLLLAFGAGYQFGGSGRTQLAVYTADGYVGADQASFVVGDTTYGFSSSVAWRDETGSEHDRGWPACLPKLQTVHAIRFGAAMVWHGSQGIASVLWVDCQPS